MIYIIEESTSRMPTLPGRRPTPNLMNSKAPMPQRPIPDQLRTTATKSKLGTAVTAALSMSVAAVAVSLALGVTVGLPIALQRFRALGGGGDHEPNPTPVVRIQYTDSIGAVKGVFNAIEQTADGGIIMVGGAQQVGRTDSDIVVVKAKAANTTDPAQEGAVDWVKYYNPSGGDYDAAAAVEQTDDDGDGRRDDGFIIAGTLSQQGNTSMFLLKLNAQGNLDGTWGAKNPVQYKGSAASHQDEAFDVHAVTGVDGQPDGYLMVGKSGYFNGAVTVSDVGVVRTDRLGQPDLTWHGLQLPFQPVLFGETATFEVGYSVQSFTNGFLIVGSSAGAEGSNPHPLILKIGTDGDQQQLTVLDTLGVARSVVPTYERVGQPLNGFIVAGSANQNTAPYEEAFLLKLTSSGSSDPSWTPNPRTYGGLDNDSANGVRQVFDSASGAAQGYLFAGGSNSQDPGFQTDGQVDVYAVQTDLSGAQVKMYLPHRTGADRANAVSVLADSTSAFASVGLTTIIDPNPEVEIRRVPELILYPGGSGPIPDPTLRRGDSDDNGSVNLSDVVFTLNALFKGGPQPTCPDAADADDNGEVNLSDGSFVLNYLFKGSGLPPPAPGAETRGVDPTPDNLSECTYVSP